MLTYSIRRLFMLIPVLIGMSLIVFGIIRAIPGDPAQAILGEKATPAAIHSLRHTLGLDQPWYVQYVSYVKDLLHGNLGDSIRTHTAISSEIGQHLAATGELAVTAMIIAVFIGINVGIISAWKQNSVIDVTVMVLALIGVSMPIFWLGLILQWLFSTKLGLLPSIGRDDIRNPVQAITNFYLIDTLIQGNFSQLWMVFRHLMLPSLSLATI
ncbi:MAG TPA: ABC transporter permease, partial [Candidatus Angelobacter sp.]|nr:ABC transporter permease [Candidatus Angelobacter sp.]